MNAPSLSLVASGTKSSSHLRRDRAGFRRREHAAPFQASSTEAITRKVSSKRGSAFNMGCEGSPQIKRTARKAFCWELPWLHEAISPCRRRKTHGHWIELSLREWPLWRLAGGQPQENYPFLYCNSKKKPGEKRSQGHMYSVSSNTDPHQVLYPYKPRQKVCITSCLPTLPTVQPGMLAGPIIPGCICGWVRLPSYRKSNSGIVQPFWYKTLE